MKALVFQAITAVAVPYTAFAQPTDYRVTESTQACERWDMGACIGREREARASSRHLAAEPLPVRRRGPRLDTQRCGACSGMTALADGKLCCSPKGPVTKRQNWSSRRS